MRPLLATSCRDSQSQPTNIEHARLTAEMVTWYAAESDLDTTGVQ